MNKLPFEEIRLSLFDDDWPRSVARYSDAQRVPVLIDGGLRVWDSFAIIEYLVDCYDTPVAWPKRRQRLAHARSIAAEMHSGFLALRAELPQNLRARRAVKLDSLSADCRSQVARIETIWNDCRRQWAEEGPWLFGRMSIADIIYAPVALRFVTYGIVLTGAAAQYVSTVTDLADVRDWTDAAAAEPESLAFIDDLTPVEQTPLRPG